MTTSAQDPQAPEPTADLAQEHWRQYEQLVEQAARLANTPLASAASTLELAALMVAGAMLSTDYEVARRAHGLTTAYLESCIRDSGYAESEAVSLLSALKRFVEDFGGWIYENGQWRRYGDPAIGNDAGVEPLGELVDELPWQHEPGSDLLSDTGIPRGGAA